MIRHSARQVFHSQLLTIQLQCTKSTILKIVNNNNKNILKKLNIYKITLAQNDKPD